MTPSDNDPANQQVNILLVDDQAANLSFLEGVLQDLGQNLINANSGLEALRRLKEDDFALVLLDLQTQGMDGFEIARLIRSRERSRHTPIIFLSAGESTDVLVVKAYALGAVDYLHKPLLPEIVRAKVTGFVDLFRKTQQVKRQAEQLRNLERSEFEHKMAEAKQRWELDRLREESRRKNEFLAVLAHELRNPLAPIRNAARLLRLKCPADEETGWAQDVIDRQVQQMTRLVEDLLDVSRITRGKIQLQRERVDVAAVVERAVETVRPFIDDRKHELTISLPAEPAYLDADPIRLAQVLANLLNNAAKYTDEGGRIWLTVERHGEELVIRVRDTGVGIPAEFLPQIFNLFVQEDRSRERTQGGLGIGLTLVRNLVEMHAGRIEALSAGPGHGSEFVIHLPALNGPAPPPQAAKPAVEPAVARSALRILVVDDNLDSARSLAYLLKHAGHDVQSAHDGPTALEAARGRRPDVVLLDIGLPRLNGLEVAQRMRGELGMADVLLVAMTGYGQAEDRARSQKAGFNAHLVKPVDLDALTELLAHTELAKQGRTQT